MMFITDKKINILLVFFSIMFSFLVLEITLRLFFIQELKRLAIFDKELGWRGKPNGEGEFIRKQDNIRVKFKYNQYGFRDENFLPAPSTFTRIVLVGDSFVEGLEVEYESTFHKILENQLNKEFDTQFEIINLSSQGYSTAQELLALKKYWDVIRPDMVLLAFFTGNDFSDNMREKFVSLDKEGNLRFKKNTDSWLKINYLSFKRWIYENSSLVFFLKTFLQSTVRITIADSAKNEILPTSEAHIYRTSQLLISEMKKEVEGNDAIFGILIIPDKDEIAQDNAKKIQILIEFCKDEEIMYLSLFNLLTPNQYFEYDGHLNAIGHTTVANETYKFMLSSLKLKKIIN